MPERPGGLSRRQFLLSSGGGGLAFVIQPFGLRPKPPKPVTSVYTSTYRSVY